MAITPNGLTAYVPEYTSGRVGVISTATNTVTATITVGSSPGGAAISPNGLFAYVTNFGSNSVSVINTATNTVTATSTGSKPLGRGRQRQHRAGGHRRQPK